MKSLFCCLFIINTCLTVHAQDSVATDTTKWWKGDNTIRHPDFNQGNYAHGWGLINGKVPGLLIAKSGAELDNTYQVRLRGQSSFFSTVAPLVVVDGVIGSSIDAIDPMDIASVKVLDPTESAQYGMQGSNGVIEIRTHQPTKKTFKVSAQYFHAFESKIHQQKSLDAVTYRSLAGSVNFSDETNWMDEITQVGQTDLASVRISGSQNSLGYRLSINGRSRRGILINTDSKRLTIGTALSGKFFKDRLKVQYSGHIKREKSNPGLAEAFKYALISNPTLPIRNQDGTFSERDIFDYFNPVAIINLANISREVSTQNHQLNATLALGKTQLAGSYGYFDSDQSTAEDYPSQLKFRSELATDNEYQYQTNQYSLSISRPFQLGRTKILSSISHRYQEVNQEWEFVNMNPAQNFTDTDRQLIKLASFSASSLLLFQQFFIDGMINLEGSSALAADEKYQPFYQINSGYNFGPKLSSFQELVFKAGYAKSGLTPYRSGLSQQTFRRDQSAAAPIHNANANLKNEETHTISFGFNGSSSNEKLTFKTQIHRSVSTDLIGRFIVEKGLSKITYANFGEIRNAGFELSLNYNIIESGRLQWSSYFNFSTFRNRVTRLGGPSDTFTDLGFAFPGAPGFGSTNLFKLEKGKAIGTFQAPIVEDVEQNGDWSFKDLDGDGSYCNCAEDQSTDLGAGFPAFSFGWANELTYRNLKLNFLLRGVGGHHLVNMERLFYQGPSPTNLNNYNILSGFNDLSNVNNPHQYSDYFIEDAGYLTMEYIELSYEAIFDRLNATFFVTANHLFTLSSYQGNTPELRLTDTGTGSNGSFLSTQLAQISLGLDRRTEWLPSRSITLGVEVSF